MSRRASFLLLAITALCACSTFRRSRKLDILPFAENTTVMVGEYLKFSRPASWVYLNEYRDSPAVEAVREARRPLHALMQGVALYSLQVAALADSRLSQSRQATELARFIDRVVRPGVEAGYTAEVGVTVTELEVILGDIRSSQTLLAAIGAAQPLVDGVLLAAHHRLETVEALTDAASTEIMAKTERKFASLHRHLAEIARVQDRTLQSLYLIADARRGDGAALARLLAEEPDLRVTLRAISTSGRPAPLDEAANRMARRLQDLELARRQLAPDSARYVAEVREVHEIRAGFQDELRMIRATLGLWARSHRNLAAGISVPPAIDPGRFLRAAATPVLGR